MGANLDRQELIDLLIGHEKGMADLYREYARLFPSHEDFFLGLVSEEEGHANTVANLATGVPGRPPLMVNHHTIKVAALRTSLKYLRQQVELTRASKPTLQGALNVALVFERSLIEKRFFEVFQGDAPGVREILEGLTEGTCRHIERIESACGQTAPRKLERTR